MIAHHRLTPWPVVALFMVSAGAAWAIGPTAPSWKPRELITNAGRWQNHEGSDRYFAYDHHGNPGVAVVQDIGGNSTALQFARRVRGVGWSMRQPTPTNLSLFQGSYPSLAFDHSERPLITARNGGNDLIVHHFADPFWAVHGVDVVGPGANSYTATAFDLLGNGAIAYRNPQNDRLFYVYDSDHDFFFDDEVPFNVTAEGNQISMAFDPLNRPMIAHLGSDGLRFSVQEPGLYWVTTVVDPSVPPLQAVGLYPSIAVDPDTGYPAIAYTRTRLVPGPSTVSDLRYAAWNGDSWMITTVDAVGDTGLYPSLAFDPSDGNPAIAYRDATADALNLAWHDGATWRTQTVDSVGNVGFTPSLAFNDFGTGFPSIVYFEQLGGGDNVWYIDDPTPVPEPAAWMLAMVGLFVLAGRRNR